MNFGQLAVDTLRDPKGTAERIMALQIGRAELYMALIAVSAINAFLAGLSSALSPVSADPAALEAMPMLALMSRPILLFMLIAGGLFITVHGLFWAGRAMGGQGTLNDMLALLTWLQGLRAAAQACVLLLSVAVPTLGGMVALAVVIVAFWLLLHFISAALRFDSLFKAFGVLIAVSTALFLGLMMLVTLMGGAAGSMPNV